MRAAIIGLNWGRTHIASCRDNDISVECLVSRSLHNTQSVATECHVPFALNDVTEISEDIDLIILSSPIETHGELLARLPDTPLLCEKPLAVTDASLFSNRKAPTWVNYAFGKLHTSQTILEAVDSEEIGEVRHVFMSVSVFFGENRNILDWFYDCAIHPLSLLFKMFGELNPVVVREHLDHRMVIDFETDSGVTVLLEVEQATSTQQHIKLRFHGEDGEIYTEGGYHPDADWQFRPVEINNVAINEGEHSQWGDAWYWANKLYLGSVKSCLESGQQDAQLMTINEAFRFEAALLRHSVFDPIMRG